MRAVIPFAGFYNSCHSEALDYAAEQLIQDDNGDVRDGLAAQFHNEWSYTSAMLETYCKLYVEAWSEAAGIKCTFGSIDSPKYYNFETDRIFVDIDETEARRLFSRLACRTNHERMTRIAAERHTSRSGFISFYSPDWQAWGDVETWDPELLHTLILASLPEDMPNEYELVDDCNGAVSDLVYGGLTTEGERIVRIADYLRERESRKYGSKTK